MNLCCVCATAPAVAFWPCADPKIKSRPYCRACLDAAQAELLKRAGAIGRVGECVVASVMGYSAGRDPAPDMTMSLDEMADAILDDPAMCGVECGMPEDVARALREMEGEAGYEVLGEDGEVSK